MFGARLRAASKYNPSMLGVMMKGDLDEEMQMQEAKVQGMENGK